MKLGDFGLAIDVTLERAKSRVGTLDYMVSPNLWIVLGSRHSNDGKCRRSQSTKCGLAHERFSKCRVADCQDQSVCALRL
jgi:hypothetical protein